MKRLMIMALVAIFATVGAAQAADVSLYISCVDHSQPDRAIIYFGYSASEAISGTSWVGPMLNVAFDNLPNDLQAGDHPRAFSMEVYGDLIWQFVDSATGQTWELHFGQFTTGPDCAEQWQPSAPSIKIAAPGAGPYTLEIQDAYGHWSLVTDAAHPDGIVLYNNGGAVELIGSVGQDTDSSHYRLIPHS